MLRTENLTRKYGNFTALDGLTLNMADGELHGFVGPNGAGKTTTMRILSTLLPATSGKAWIDDVEVSKYPRKVRAMVGYMPDFFGVYDNLKSAEYLDFYARCYGINAADRQKMTGQLLSLVGLTDKKDAYVNALSRGMKQRLCLARALIHDPKLLILDEPASGMDPRARAEMKDILRALKDMGKTVLISSHILSELSELCDKLSILDHGKLVVSGTMEELGDKMQGNAPVFVRMGSEEAMDDTVTLLKQFPGVSGITLAENRLLQVTLAGGEDTAGALLKALMTQQLPVTDFHRAPVNLEKVFMEVTQA